LVRDPADVPAAVQSVTDSVLVGLDTETTGLNPRTDRVRLVQLATEGGVFLFDLFALTSDALRPVFELLSQKEIVAHNTAFDLAFLAPLGFVSGPVNCTMNLSRLLHGTRQKRGFHGLEQVAEREIGVKLDKGQQKSNWAGDLSPEQLQYAAADVAVLPLLFRALSAKAKLADLERVAEIERRCLLAVVWLARSGVPFDHTRWEALAREAKEEAEKLARQLGAVAPPIPDPPAPEGGKRPKKPRESWNWNSHVQVREAFALLGVELTSTKDDALARVNHLLADLLRKHRGTAKRATTYSMSWLKGSYHEGRLYAEWRQLGCITGRMAGRSPNLQNPPGDPRYRACFRAPDDRVLIKADYSQIELRIAAKVANDPVMLTAHANGEDLHALTAQRMLGREDISDRDRKLAKPVNFGLIYGLGAPALMSKAKAEYGLDLTIEDAARYRQAFFDTYRGIADWHRRIRLDRATETRTLAGRRALVEAGGFFGQKANYIVQGSAADGMKLALALLWERQGQCPDAFPVLAVHDEIVIECDRDQADAVRAWLKQAMQDGMAWLLDPVPVEVKAEIGQTWGGD
jgi:DNA polymerase-1